MPRIENDPLGDGFKWRLRAELNRIRPPYSSPRYASPPGERTGARRFATAALAVAVVGTLSLTAYAATGSANPAVWTQQIVTRIEPTVPSPSPVASESPPAAGAPPVAAPTQQAQPTSRAAPTDRPQGTPSPEQEPGDDHRASGAPTVSPSPYGGDH